MRLLQLTDAIKVVKCLLLQNHFLSLWGSFWFTRFSDAWHTVVFWKVIFLFNPWFWWVGSRLTFCNDWWDLHRGRTWRLSLVRCRPTVCILFMIWMASSFVFFLLLQWQPVSFLSFASLKVPRLFRLFYRHCFLLGLFRYFEHARTVNLSLLRFFSWTLLLKYAPCAC